jgi:rSAM/selenodomain-associated transferase 1
VTPTVLLVAKAPLPGRAKTRLVPPLSPEQAAELGGALLLDTLDDCAEQARELAARLALLHADPEDAPELRRVAGAGVELVAQEGRGLGDALARGMERHLAGGAVAMVSGDIPGLPDGALARTFAALEGDADVVLGPALDGGYWLIAMRRFHPEPFRDIPWSTPAVLGVTLERCSQAGLRVELLEPWRDVDTLPDLDALLADAGRLPERTAAVVAGLIGVGVVSGRPPGLRLLRSELLASSPWRAVVSDTLAAAGGETGYAYLAVPRAVFVVPVTDGGDIVLVRQYRHPVRDWTLEVPAGTLADGEAPLDAAKRELLEEVGGEARDWRHLTTFYSSSAHISLRSDAFLATGVTLAQASPDEGEELELVRLPAAEALARASAGGFAEGQTALSILLAARYIETHGT